MTWIASLAAGLAFVAAGSAPALAQDAGKPHAKPEKPQAQHPEKKVERKGEAKVEGEHGAPAAAGAEVGKPAPDFTLTGTDGKTYKAADLKDKIVVLEWINRECPVCQKQAPSMKETAAALQKKGVIWLAVDSSAHHKLADNAEHAKKESLSYPILDDAAGTVGHAFGAKSTPTTYVINKGTLAYSGALIPQEKGDSRNYVTEAVEALLAGKEAPTSTTKAYGCSVKYKKD
ncbi:MAG: redoxin domain-containing protein [Planctomycetes bacterium]|nr:redoxin domain-containing protein [Planctomycetota bacterium]